MLDKLFAKNIKLILSPYVVIDGRIVDLLQNLPFKMDVLVLKKWTDDFKKWMDSSSPLKKEARRALATLEMLQNLKNVNLIETDGIFKFSLLLRKYRKKDRVYVVEVDNEVDHYSLLYKYKTIKLNLLSDILHIKYWIGKIIQVQPLREEDEFLTGHLKDGTTFYLPKKGVTVGKTYSCKITSMVNSHMGITLYLKRDKIYKKRKLWDLLQ